MFPPPLQHVRRVRGQVTFPPPRVEQWSAVPPLIFCGTPAHDREHCLASVNVQEWESERTSVTINWQAIVLIGSKTVSRIRTTG